MSDIEDSTMKRCKYDSYMYSIKYPLTEAEMLKLLDEQFSSDTEPFEAESSDESEDGTVTEEENENDNGDVDTHLQQNARNKENMQEISTKIIWNDDSSNMREFTFSKREELLVSPKEGSCLDYFLHILSDDFLQLIVTRTNEYAVQLFLRTTGESARINKWKNVTREELLKFIGLLLHIGHIKMNRIQDYWKQDSLHKINIFHAVMSRNRFLLLLRALNFSNNDEAYPEDKLHKIRPIINHFNQRMCDIYYPGRELCIDESLVLWRRRLQSRQCISNKKYGLKLCMLTDAKRLVLKVAIHAATFGDTERKGRAEKVVMELLSEKLNVGHSVYLDNYYNSYSVAKQLLEEKTYCTGTLRLCRKSCPEQVKSAKLKKGATIGKYANGILIGKWKGKREVSYISTEFKNDMIKVINKRNEAKNKPRPIVEYNKHMSGIDHLDQMLSYYNCERKSFRWPTKIFVHILQVVMNNAHQLFNKYSHVRLSFYDFRIEVVKGLLQQPDAEKQPREQPHTEHILSQRDVRTAGGKMKRKQCKSCYDRNKKRKDSIYVCKACPNEPGYCLDCAKITHM